MIERAGKFSRAIVRLSAVALLCAGMALASGVSIGVYASVAPDPTATNYSAYLADALHALSNNMSSYGSYSQVTAFTPGQAIGTGFDCYSSAISADCKSDKGSIVLNGVAIKSTGTQFSLNDVNFQFNNFFGVSDPVENLGTTLGGYSDRIWGYDSVNNIWYNAATPGSASTLVNEIYFAGFGDQFYVANPADLAAAIALISGASNVAVNTQYTVNIGGTPYTGYGEAHLPEPSTYALVGAGILAVGALGRRRKKA